MLPTSNHLFKVIYALGITRISSAKESLCTASIAWKTGTKNVMSVGARPGCFTNAFFGLSLARMLHKCILRFAKGGMGSLTVRKDGVFPCNCEVCTFGGVLNTGFSGAIAPSTEPLAPPATAPAVPWAPCHLSSCPTLRKLHLGDFQIAALGGVEGLLSVCSLQGRFQC